MKRMNRSQLISFFERLEMYLGSGLALDRSLSLCSALSVRAHIERGSLLSSALEKELKISKTISGIISQGETSGSLSDAIGKAKAILEREDQIIKNCISAAIYPMVIGAFSIVFVIAIIRGVMPQITPMLTSMHMKLPMLSRIMIYISNAMSSYWIYIFASAFIIPSIFIFAYKRSAAFKHASHSLVAFIPIIGKSLKSFNLSVFLMSLGSLIESGLPVYESYTRSINVISLIPLKERYRSMSSEVSEGYPVSKALQKARAPEYIHSLALAGEASGFLGRSIIRSAGILERDLESTIKRASSLIEPIMMIAMGIVVGSIALSILLPIYDLSKTLQH